MKKLLVVLALLAGVSGLVSADGINTVVNPTTLGQWTQTVFNDSGGSLTSGSVVIWDNDDTEFDRSGYRYVTTTTTVDSDWVAGVTLNDTCADQALCEIVVKGPAITRIANSTDVVSEDEQVSTSGVAGQAGDYGTGANTCVLGTAMELREAYTGNTTGLTQDNQPMWVYVQPACN